MYAYLLGFVMAAAGGAETAQAGAPYLGLDLGDVVVATVKKVSDHAATNGKPPRVELEVHEVLRGDAALDRTRAVWTPTPHGVDFGDPELWKKAVQEWEAKKFVGPNAGDKFVLWGKMAGDKKRPVFEAYSWHAYPFSAEKRTWAVKAIRDAQEEARRYAEELEAEKQALAKAVAQWRAKASADDVKQYAAEADLVAVGRIVGGSENVEGGSTLQVRILKGEKRRKYNGDLYFVEVTAPQEVQALLDRETDYLLFRSLEGLKTGTVVDNYPPVKTGDGIVIADEKALEAVTAALEQKDQEEPDESPQEMSVEAYDSQTRGALQVKVDDKDPSDSFDVLQDDKRVKGAPKLLNAVFELPPGDYVVEVNKTQRKVNIEAGKKTILWTGELVVEGKPTSMAWYAMQGKQKLTSSGVEPLLNKARPLFAGSYAVFVDTSLTGKDKSLGKAEVKVGRKTVLKH